MKTVIGLVLLAVIAAGSLWNAAESHYRSCIEAQFASEYVQVPAGTIVIRGRPAPAGRLTAVNVSGCKRWPPL